MPKVITMYNVGFGDSYLINIEDHKLLVDCGSHNKIKDTHSNLLPLVSNIVGDINLKLATNEDNSLLITHFHTDHYNLLPYLTPKVFNCIYVRNIYRDEVTYSQTIFDLIEDFLDDQPESFDDNLFQVFFIKRVYTLLSDRGCITFIREGSTFNVGNTNFYVHSPFKNRTFVKENVVNLLNFYGKSFDCNDEISGIRDYLSFLSKRLRKYESINKERVFRILEDKKYKKYEKNAQESCRKLLAKIRSSKIDVDLAQSLKRISEYEHKYNIVFSSYEDGLLFCGDENNDDMVTIRDQILSQSPNQKFSIIKIPHHGTLSHYFDFRNFSPNIGLVLNQPCGNYESPDWQYKSDFNQIITFYGSSSNSKKTILISASLTYF
jgi:ribonuclease BN (tRNA processing enzyme)